MEDEKQAVEEFLQEEKEKGDEYMDYYQLAEML